MKRYPLRSPEAIARKAAYNKEYHKKNREAHQARKKKFYYARKARIFKERTGMDAPSTSYRIPRVRNFTEKLCLLITPEMDAEIKAVTRAMKMTRTEVVRILLDRGMPEAIKQRRPAPDASEKEATASSNLCDG